MARTVILKPWSLGNSWSLPVFHTYFSHRGGLYFPPPLQVKDMRTSSSRRCSVAMRALPGMQHLWWETIQSHQIHKCFWFVGSSPDGNNFEMKGFNLFNVVLEPFSLPASTNSRTSRTEGLYPTGRSQVFSSITNPGSMSHWTNPLKLCKIQWKERNSLSGPLISETIDTI